MSNVNGLNGLVLKSPWIVFVQKQENAKCCFFSYRLINDLDVKVFNFKRFGKELPKRNKLSPNAFIQVALQLSYYRCHSFYLLYICFDYEIIIIINVVVVSHFKCMFPDTLNLS